MEPSLFSLYFIYAKQVIGEVLLWALLLGLNILIWQAIIRGLIDDFKEKRK